MTVATLANTGSRVLWGHEDKWGHEIDMILLQYDPARLIDALFNSLDDLLSGRRPQKIKWSWSGHNYASGSNALKYNAPKYFEGRYPSCRL